MGGALLKGGCILSLDKHVGNLHQADVRIEDDRVAEVGRDLRARGVEVIDATDTIVMPGFVDAHRHVWRTLLRNTGADGSHRASLDAHAHRLEPDDVYAATLLGLLGAVQAGITTVVDWSEVLFDDRFVQATVQAHADAGLRSVLVHGTAGSAPAGDADALRQLFSGRHRSLGPSTTLALGAPEVSSSELTSSDGAAPDLPPSDPAVRLDALTARWSLARELGVRIHAHVGDPADRGVVATMGRQGLLDGDVTLVHGSQLGDDDLDAIASAGAALALTPASEMTWGRGVLPVQSLIDRGIRPGLGVDDERLTAGDLFAQMRAVQSLQHATVFDRKLAGKGSLPGLLSTRDVIRYATHDGARVAGLQAVTGSLTPGKQADLVLLRTDRPNIAPVNDPIGAVVWGMDASNVHAVFVAGRPLLRDGVLDADIARVRRLAVEASERLAAATGGLVETGEGAPR